MSNELKFHLDENVDTDIAEALRNNGIDVTVTNEVGLVSASDLVQLEYARNEKRVIITHDIDFLRIASKTSNHFGIVFCKTGGYSIGKIVLHCISMHHRCVPDDMIGLVEYL
jgi:predicted nuclease of predicted toxin-antitoxin system